MFTEFFFELRRFGVKVGLTEARSVARALELGVHDSTLDGFYAVARALCVHREGDLDKFDAAFASYFHGTTAEAVKLTEELLEWLKDPALPTLSDEERKLLEGLDLEEVMRMLEERLREQRERHDGGNRWIGTGGTSPFGQGGVHPGGVRIGDDPQARKGRGMGAIRMASERRFRDLRGDVTLDMRQIELALRRLRTFAREGSQRELDLEATIDKTAQNAGELDVVVRPPRRPNLRVLLLIDVGGSMDPHADVSSRLFSAARRATHFKELRTYYFHNCIYGHVYPSARLYGGIALQELMQTCDASWRLILVGDGLMSPAELYSSGGLWTYGERSDHPAITWLIRLGEHFRRTAWLNPEPAAYWRGTAEVIARVFPMFRLTLDGLTEAIAHLTKGAARR